MTNDKDWNIILFDNEHDKIDYQQREKGIEIAASIAKFLGNHDFQVGLLGPNLCIEQSGGVSSLKRIFVALALLDADQDFQTLSFLKSRHLTETCIYVNLDNLEVSQTKSVVKNESII